MADLKRITASLSLKTTPHAVFQALTRPDELVQWFCAQAEVDLAENRYDFWGELTPEAPDQSQGRHTILALEPDRLLKFGWHFRGVDSMVTYHLMATGDHTEITVIHENVMPYRPGQYAVTDFWSLTLENLRAWVEQRQVGARCNFATVPRGDVHLDIEIDAPQAEVFQALIDPGELNRYIAHQAHVEPTVDGDYDFGWSEGPVKILEIVPNEKLAYAWTWQDEPKTVATWTLEGSGGKTHLTLVHSGFGPDRLGEDYTVGWLHFLNRLKFMVEEGPSWQKPMFIENDY